MGTGTIFTQSDLFSINNVVQSTHSSAIKQLVVAQLREFFSADSFYHYVQDEYGFPKTIDMTDQPQDIGLHDSGSTRLYIGEYYRYEGIFYPAILVKSGSIKYKPMSINRERETVINDEILVTDGYGNFKKYYTPKAFVFAGWWEGDITLEIWARGIRTRDDLCELVMLLFSDIKHREMDKMGIIIQNVSAGSPSETDDRNDKLHRVTVTLNIVSHWRREIPIVNTVDAINLCVEFASNLDVNPPVIDPNLTINTNISLLDQIQNM